MRRSDLNIRQRANGNMRHDPFNQVVNEAENNKFIDPTDLEWMSLNYRKERAAKICPSKRRMILIML